MNLTPEMKEMLEAIKKNEKKLKSRNDALYYAPNIPDGIKKKMLKNFDLNISINEVVAFIDESLLRTASAGYVFTTDGYYYKMGVLKANYYNYKDIESIFFKENDGVYVRMNTKIKEEKRFSDNEFGQGMYDVLSRLIRIDRIYGQTYRKLSGQVKPIDIPKDMLKGCHGIIHGASAAAATAASGLAQIPGSDNAVLLPIQVGMLVALGGVFDINITESGAKGLVLNYGASLAGRTLSQVLVGWIPGFGNAINATTAAGITELMGWLVVEDFYQRWLEDKSKGKLDGIKAGYEQASKEFEQKFRKQAEEFLKQGTIFKEQVKEYHELLKAYEEYIKELEGKVAASDILAEYEKLKAMQPEPQTEQKPVEPKYKEDIDVESEYED